MIYKPSKIKETILEEKYTIYTNDHPIEYYNTMIFKKQIEILQYHFHRNSKSVFVSIYV